MSNTGNFVQSSLHESNLNLEEFTKCYICLCKIQEATMCPNCQKISCQRCIQKWLMERKSQCPHCRMPLKLSQIINVRFINELSSLLENINNSKKKKSEVCKEHNISILYFCVDCNESLCSDCYMFGKKHKEHEINKLEQVYSAHVDMIKSESKEVQKKYELLNSFLKSINDKIISVGSFKLEKSNELEELFENLKNKLENKVHLKLTKLMSCKNEISEKLKFLENVKLNIEKELSEAPKSILITKSEEMINNLKNLNIDSETLESQFMENLNMNISNEIASDVLPFYESSYFEIPNFKSILAFIQSEDFQKGKEMSDYKISKEKEFIYSNELVTNGLVWRIKVYPFGNSGARGEYISIFLELIEGLLETSKYYYKIELCNFSDNERKFANHSREFSSDFSNGECWGYNRFYKLESLERDGFIDSKRGLIRINFYVRPQTYSQLCRDQKNYINTLENRLKHINILNCPKEVDINSHNQVNTNIDNVQTVQIVQITNALTATDLIRTSDEIAINNFNLINNINNAAEEINIRDDQEALNNINHDDALDNNNYQQLNLGEAGNKVKVNHIEVALNSPEARHIPDNSDINLINVKKMQNVRENKVIMDDIKVSQITAEEVFNTLNNLDEEVKINKNLNDEIKLINRENERIVSNNFNLDIYDPDLSLNSSTKEILQGNFDHYLLDKKNISYSGDGSSFNSLLDSMKIIDDSSFQKKTNRQRKVEKEVDGLSEEKNLKKYNLSTAQNFFKNKIEKELRSSNDKFNDILNNLYPENVYSNKSSLKKYIQSNNSNSLSKNLSSKLNSYKINLSNSSPMDNIDIVSADSEEKNKKKKSQNK